MQWKCEVCKKLRDDADIAVFTQTTSDRVLGNVDINVKYCKDNEDCKVKAELRARDLMDKFLSL